jgi:hypothetical protein
MHDIFSSGKAQMHWREWQSSAEHSLATQIARWLEIVHSGEEYGKFLTSCDMREEGIQLLLRSTTNCVLGPCMTVATIQIEAEAQRAGLFKDLLAYLWKVNPWPMLVMEDVENPNLRAFLQRIGAKVLNESYKTTYVVPRESIARFAAGFLRPYSAYRRALPGDA